jgi:hypothetical protein
MVLVSTDTELARELERARYVLAGSDGILRSYGTFGGERKRVWKVIAGGRQVSMWTKRRWARRALREELRDRKSASTG